MTEGTPMVVKRPAGFWIRYLALVLDGIIIAPFAVLNWFAYKNMNFPLLLVANVPWWFYKPIMEAKWGATVGKMICRIRVETEEGANITLRAAYVRFLPFILYSIVYLVLYFQLFRDPAFTAATVWSQRSVVEKANPVNSVMDLVLLFLSVDCLVAAFAGRKRALHDMMAKSVCVYRNVRTTA